MAKEIILTDQAPAPIGPYSQAVRYGSTLYVSGQIPFTADGNFVGGTVEAQTKQVMLNLNAILEAAGLTFDHVLKCSIFIKDMNDFVAINDVYASYFGDNAPARETVEVARLPKDVLVEISCIAAA